MVIAEGILEWGRKWNQKKVSRDWSSKHSVFPVTVLGLLRLHRVTVVDFTCLSGSQSFGGA